MVNFNGTIISKTSKLFTANNRAFKYGDALFETLKTKDEAICFLEDHYFRLMASMRMLRMEIPMHFTMEFFEKEILNTLKSNQLLNARVRITVFRNDGGLYLPTSNKTSFLIEVNPLKTKLKESYSIDLFRDYYLYSGLLSSLKTTNKLTHVLANIYAAENNFDNCILLNEKKQVVEAINGNIFVVKGNTIKTPPVTEGCVKGIARKKIIELVTAMETYTLEEVAISPFELQKADEIFISNVIVGVQAVTKYKKSVFKTKVSKEIAAFFSLS